MYQQDSYYEACDNVYEDVENLNKMISGQNSQKRKGVLKSKDFYLMLLVLVFVYNVVQRILFSFLINLCFCYSSRPVCWQPLNSKAFFFFSCNGHEHAE